MTKTAIRVPPSVSAAQSAVRSEKEKCRSPCGRPAFFSRCAAKTELCVTVQISLGSGFFRFQSLHGMSTSDESIDSPEGVSRRPIQPRFEINFECDESLLRKEVIQPQVPLRLPCYDFIPITIHTFGAF